MTSPPRDLRPLLALLLALAGALVLGLRWRLAAVVLAGVALVGALRGLFYVLGAKAAMSDPDARPAGREKAPPAAGG